MPDSVERPQSANFSDCLFDQCPFVFLRAESEFSHPHLHIFCLQSGICNSSFVIRLLQLLFAVGESSGQHLLQIGHKSFMYMHLYAESTLALVETPFQEIQFKQIVGDFQTLQGKIMIQEDSLDKVRS